MTNSLIYMADSYKYSHFKQYPPGTEYVSSYIESRGGEFDEVVFFGLQGFIEQYLMNPINRAQIDRMETLMKAHGVSFNREGWERIVELHKGYIPVAIYAVPEGSVVPTKNALVRITNTDPDLPWVTSFIETALLRAIWYPSTVATYSRECKKIIAKYMDQTAGHRDGLDFMLHDFGGRGVSSHESAQIGGAAHLVNFKGTDTFEAILWLQQVGYVGFDEMPAFSVDATEHSTVTTWGPEREAEMYEAYIDTAKEGQILSCVSDSYSIWNAVRNIWGGKLRSKVVNMPKGARLVVRPDSGDPVLTPVYVVQELMASFGHTVNKLGYKVLPPYLRVLQGDGIGHIEVDEILAYAASLYISAENFVFGMGGGLLQNHTRDTQKFAMKASAAYVDGKWVPVFKDPIDDKGKASKKGMVALVGNATQEYFPYGDPEGTFVIGDRLQPVYRNGHHLRQQSLDDIRELAQI